MSQIAHDFYASNPLIFLPLLALLIFVAFFLTIIVRAVLANPAELNASAQLPFDSTEGRHE